MMVHSSIFSSTPRVSEQPGDIGRQDKSGAGHTTRDLTTRGEAEEEACAPSRFAEVLSLFADFGNSAGSTKLFPKTCRVCGRKFRGLSEYLCATTPKGHVFEDCREVMKRPFTMVYRHCPCGNTLVITFTEDNFPNLDFFWSALHEEARQSDRLLSAVVAEFSTECDRYLLLLHNPCLGNEQRLEDALLADLDGDE